ncbi:MAG: SH3 domain-containing protein [Bacteroidales bacterium]|nr:SH3 domain-containing protein [Bacteroidales bacterium]
MKRGIITLLMVLAVFNAIGQLTLKQIDKKLDSLQTAKLTTQQRIAAYQDQLKQINKEIADLTNQKKNLMMEVTGDYIQAKTGSGGAILRDKPSSLGNVIVNIPANTDIKVYKEQQNLYFKVNFNGQEGYVSYSTIAANQEIDDFLSGKPSNAQTKSQSTTVVRSVNENDPKYQKLVKLYGKDIAIRIMNNEVWEGMTPGMTLESIGKPNSKSSINADEGVKEVWEYNDYKLEFFNGSVSKIIKK